VSRSNLTVPNIVSAVRIATVPIFLWLLFGLDEPGWAGLLLGGIGATDWVDGYLARRLGQVTELGKALDPVADRLAIAAAVVGGWVAGVLPWLFALLLVVRELVIGAGAIILAWKASAKLEVRYLGKVATFGLYFSIPSFYVYAGTDLSVFIWLAWVFGVPGLFLYYVVGGEYLADMRRILVAPHRPPSA
jgi:cardiolipin synthase